jgi:ERCC4-type nuclease
MTGLPLTDKAHYKHNMITEFPDGMIIVIDTRESDPLFHYGGRLKKGIPVIRKKLEYGDYALQGFTDGFVVERKKHGDLYGSLGKGRERFYRELDRMSTAERPYIMVEGTESDILQSFKYSRMHPNVIRQSIASIEMTRGIPFYYSGNSKQSELWLIDRMVKYYRWKRGGD